MSASPTPTKKTIYVDVDEEITGIIDKVKTTNESIIALVLPKRATVLQSIVNMKLLKRAANQDNKKVVLITSESTLLPLAGAAGIHVAANLQSRPIIPPAPGASPVNNAPVVVTDDKPIDPETPIGDLAPVTGASTVQPIEIDNSPKESDADLKAASVAAGASAVPKKAKKDKNKMVPNFHKFRTLLFAGAGALVLLLFGLYWALAIAPKATVSLRTQTSETPATAQFSADTDADEINLEKDILPAISKELKKTETEKVAATGEKDNGTKASGQIDLRNCTGDDVTVPAGTGISNGNFTFIVENTVKLNDGNFEPPNRGGTCKTGGDHTGQVNVIAQKNGDQYNLSAPRTYTVAGFSGVIAESKQAMSGGATKVVKIISAENVEAAKKKISDKQNAVVEQLKTEQKDSGYVGLVDTFSAGTPNFTATPAVGAEANEVTVSGDVTYTMLGVKEADLKKILEDQSKETVDTSKQNIVNYGFDEATYEVGAKRGSTTAITLKTTLVAGAEINQDALKKELAGKKRNDAESQLKSRPGVTDARVSFKPFWVSKVPSKESKVTFVIEQANGKPVTP